MSGEDWMVGLTYLATWTGGAGLALIVAGLYYSQRLRKVEARAESLDRLVMQQHERYCRMATELDGHKARIRELSTALARAGHPEVGRNGLAAKEPSDPAHDRGDGPAE